MRYILTLAAVLPILCCSTAQAQIANSAQGMFLGRNMQQSTSGNFEYCNDWTVKAAARIDACKRISATLSDRHSEVARFILVVLYKDERRYGDALAILNALYEQYNTNSAYREKAVVLQSRSELYAIEGRFDDAIADEKMLASIYPGELRSYNSSCWIRAITGRELETALTDCDQALSIKQDDSSTLDSRGLVNLKLGRLDDALADYDAALAANPKLASSVYGRGIAKIRKGDVAAGQEDLAAAEKLRPDAAIEMENCGIKP